jgi:hypothetical protein
LSPPEAIKNEQPTVWFHNPVNLLHESDISQNRDVASIQFKAAPSKTSFLNGQVKSIRRYWGNLGFGPKFFGSHSQSLKHAQ